MVETDNSGEKDSKVSSVGLFLGCIIPTEQYAYELSLRRVLPELGIEVKELEGASCCGAPLRSINLNLSMYLSLRNLAICEMAGLDMLAPCPICHLALSEAKNLFCSADAAEEIARRLDGLSQDVRDAIRVARLAPQLGVERSIELLLGG